MNAVQKLILVLWLIDCGMPSAFAESRAATTSAKILEPLIAVAKPAPIHSAKKQKHFFSRPSPQKNANKPRLSVENTQPSAAPLTPAPMIEHQTLANAIDPLLNKAFDAYQKADFINAGVHYQEAFALDSNNRDALLGLAAVAQQQGRMELAGQLYEQLIGLNPQDSLAQAGLISLKAEEFSLVQSRLMTLLTRYPNSAYLYFVLANQYVTQSRWQEAETAYFQAVRLEPSNALFAYDLAICLDHISQPGLAIQFYQKAVQLNADEKAGFLNAVVQQRINALNVARH